VLISAHVQIGTEIHRSSFLLEYRNSFSRVKQPGCDVDHALASSVGVKEIGDLYVNSLSVHAWNIAGRPLSLKEGMYVTDDGHTNDHFCRSSDD
jgi:hypothetical protein